MDIRHFRMVFMDVCNSKKIRWVNFGLAITQYFNAYFSAFFVLRALQKCIDEQVKYQVMENSGRTLNVTIKRVDLKTNFTELIDLSQNDYLGRPIDSHYTLVVEITDTDGKLCTIDVQCSESPTPVYGTISFSIADEHEDRSEYDRYLTRETVIRIKKSLQLALFSNYASADDMLLEDSEPQPALKLYQPGEKVYFKGQASLICARRTIVERIPNRWPETYWVWGPASGIAYGEAPASALYRRDELMEDIGSPFCGPISDSITEEMREELDGFKRFLEEQFKK